MADASDYQKLSLSKLYASLRSSHNGLSDVEASHRLLLFGPNKLRAPKKHLLFTFFKRYWGPLPWLLELSILLSLLLGHIVESYIIFFLLSMNAFISFVHESTIAKAYKLLKEKMLIQVKTMRNGSWKIEEARNLVPGDIIALKAGDSIPADSILTSGSILVNESCITGESLPKTKNSQEILFGSSLIQQGEATAIVITTGEHTLLGKTATLVKESIPPSHQEQVILEITKYMMYVSLSFSLVFVLYAFFEHLSLLSTLSMILLFLMAAVPVALPTVMTMIQSICSIRLQEKGALVTRLNAIEDAASIDRLCIDKTGTITEGKLQVQKTYVLDGYSHDRLIQMALLASRAEMMDPIDSAIDTYAKENNILPYPAKILSYIPFEASTKKTEAIIEENKKTIHIQKGAPQVLLPLCSNAYLAKETIENFAKNGYRTIAVLAREERKDSHFQLIGIIAFCDPLRADSKEMIEQIKSLGIKPLLVTGDSLPISKEIAQEASIGRKIFSRDEMDKINFSDIDGFAEIYPIDKHTIIKTLQNEGHYVGMTGDGVNDAPALRQAELGISVSSATEIAKSSASVILTKPGLKVIVDLIIESRKTYQRMVTWVLNKITKVFQVTGLLITGFLLTGEAILSLVGMALLLVATDCVTLSLATDEVQSTSLPNFWNIKKLTLSSILIGTLLLLEGILVLLFGTWYLHLTPLSLQSYMLLYLVTASQCRVLLLRERNSCYSSKPGNALLLSTTVTILLFMCMASFGILITPLSPLIVIVLTGVSILGTLALDVPKKYIFGKILKENF